MKVNSEFWRVLREMRRYAKAGFGPRLSSHTVLGLLQAALAAGFTLGQIETVCDMLQEASERYMADLEAEHAWLTACEKEGYMSPTAWWDRQLREGE